MNPVDPSRPVVLTGVTGYVGGRLLPRLVETGYRVRCLVRRPDAVLAALPGSWRDRVEVCAADVLDRPALDRGLRGAGAAFYLVHSMGSRGKFVARDREGAGNFAEAARRGEVGRIIYLGGLGADEDLSPHLASRHEVGRIFRDSGVPTVEFRASIILGSGSLSYDMIRALVERLPVMTTPRWVRCVSQPVAIEDVLEYLLGALRLELEGSLVYEIGGPDRVSYDGLLREYARRRGLKRWIIPVPLLTPGLSSKWLGLVTPLYARVGRKLIDSVRHDTVVKDLRARRDFPGIRPLGIREALARAIGNEGRSSASTRWSDAMSAGGDPPDPVPSPSARPRVLTDVRSRSVNVSPEQAFVPVQCIGGETGWYYGNLLWRLRGFLDLLVGGVGLRRGRPHPTRTGPGQPLDFWRVEAFDPPRLMRLRAEMKVPGLARLEFAVAGEPGAAPSTITQTASFEVEGLAGRLYWYALAPAHRLVFSGMLDGIVSAAENPDEVA